MKIPGIPLFVVVAAILAGCMFVSLLFLAVIGG